MTTASSARAVLLLAFAAVAGCSRNDIEAVNLANEGDQAKATNVDEAISKFEQATQLDPSNHRIAWKLALAYSKKEDWAKTAAACAKAEKVAPTFANYYAKHGYALSQQAAKGATGWGEAKQVLQEAVAKDPNLADAYEDLAEVLHRMDDEAGALQTYTKAIETKPDELQYYVPLADLYLRLGFLNEAEQTLKEALNFGKDGDKHLFEIHSLLGGIYETKGNISGATSEYEAAKKACGTCQDAAHQIAYFNLGSAYYMTEPRRQSEAVNNLKTFYKLSCKGGMAKRFADQCTQTQEFAKNLKATLE